MRNIILVLALLSSSAALSADTAQTEYRSVHGVFRASEVVKKYPRLIAISKIESKDPAVLPSSMKIEIQAKGGRIRVPIDAHGRAEFPMSDTLLEENPLIVSDQPIGSLRVSMAVEVRLPSSADIAYAELLLAIEDVEAATSVLSQGQESPQIDGLELRFDPKARARVAVTWEGGEDLFVADSLGRVFLRRNLSQSRDVDTTLHFSAAPLRVLPRLQRP